MQNWDDLSIDILCANAHKQNFVFSHQHVLFFILVQSQEQTAITVRHQANAGRHTAATAAKVIRMLMTVKYRDHFNQLAESICVAD